MSWTAKKLIDNLNKISKKYGIKLEELEIDLIVDFTDQHKAQYEAPMDDMAYVARDKRIKLMHGV